MKGKFAIAFGLLALLLPAVCAQLTRTANSTLRLPQNPASSTGYRWEPAFGYAFRSPVALASPPGETNRIFVVDRRGIITSLTNLTAAKADAQVILNITNQVSSYGDEEGMLGVAFHPNFADNGFFYVFYTATNYADPRLRFDRLSRFQLSSTNSAVSDTNSQQIIINQVDFWDNHNAGDLHFGPDGYLYVSLGDGGGVEGDQGGNGQRIDKDFFSGIIRIDVDKRPGNLPPSPHPAASENYLVPADNPFIGSTSFNGVPLLDPSKVRTEFWAVGLRNPWRMSFDPLTGALWCGDVGERLAEEINIITKGDNYGWSIMEGTNVVKTRPATFTSIPAIYEYSQGPLRAVIGGRVYRGARIPQLQGAYIFTDFYSGNTLALRLNTAGKAEVQPIAQLRLVQAFGVDPSNGDLLACVADDGTIRRLTYSDGQGEPLPNLLSETGAFTDLPQLTPAPGLVPYEINLPFWSDGAEKTRWMAITNLDDQIIFHGAEPWETPRGAVWIKHFEIQTTNGEPASVRRLETRFLVRNSGGIYGVTYRWNGAGDAQLVPETGLDEDILITDRGTTRTQVWRYPSRTECASCHTAQAGWVLGFNTAQMNRAVTHGALTENQITALANAGYLQNAPEAPQTFRALAPPGDTQTSQEYRVRSYLAANCSQCHRPSGPTSAAFDTRIDTLTDDAGLIRAPTQRIAGPMLTFERNSVSRSMIHYRMSLRGNFQMPPWGSNIPDPEGLELMRSFIVGELVTRQGYISNWVQINFPDPKSPSASPEADPDADGASNMLEFLTGGRPLAPGDEWKISADITTAGVEIYFRHPANRSVLIETADLVPTDWKPLNVLENRVHFPATPSDRVITDPGPPGRAKFYRAQISPP